MKEAYDIPLSLNYKKGNKLDLNKIKTDHLNLGEKEEILIWEYSDISYNEKDELTFTNQVKHLIRTTEEIPDYTKNYRYREIYKKEINNKIQDMIRQKIIKPSKFDWNSPIWIVSEKILYHKYCIIEK